MILVRHAEISFSPNILSFFKACHKKKNKSRALEIVCCRLLLCKAKQEKNVLRSNFAWRESNGPLLKTSSFTTLPFKTRCFLGGWRGCLQRWGVPEVSGDKLDETTVKEDSHLTNLDLGGRWHTWVGGEGVTGHMAESVVSSGSVGRGQSSLGCSAVHSN